MPPAPRRCCSAVPDEFAPTYASVLVGDLPARVARLEQHTLVPCLTAWCQRCSRAYLLTTALPLFPSPSAHHAHMVVLAERLAAAAAGDT
jgi:hypothetical protein